MRSTRKCKTLDTATQQRNEDVDFGYIGVLWVDGVLTFAILRVIQTAYRMGGHKRVFVVTLESLVELRFGARGHVLNHTMILWPVMRYRKERRAI